jgi:5-methylcytosine-specific restriction endonuclease McrA
MLLLSTESIHPFLRIPAPMAGRTSRSRRRARLRRWLRELYPDGACSYCSKPAADTLDHVVPEAAGGKTWHDNLVPACLRCNAKKADKSLLMFLWHRGRQPEAFL